MTPEAAQHFAEEWVAAWNARDLDRILSHYAEEIVFHSPNAQRVVGTGRVEGIAALRAYWSKALAGNTSIHFTLTRVYAGADALTIGYDNHRGQKVTETVVFDGDGKVVFSAACYADG